MNAVLDARTMPKLKNSKSAEVDVALEAWARWAKRSLETLGWSPSTLIARVIEFGVLGAALQGGKTLEADSVCEMVERAVMRLDPEEREVIVRRYLYWEPREVSAKHCGMTVGAFATVLHRARRTVWGFLEGIKLHYTK